MAPSAATRKKARRTRKPRRIHCKKRLVKSKDVKETSTAEDVSSSITTTASFNACSNIDGLDFEGVDISTSSCSTPKGKKFRIPEIVTCPPAPKKQRSLSNWSLQRRPIAFFASPDLEHFFFYAFRDISV